MFLFYTDNKINRSRTYRAFATAVTTSTFSLRGRLDLSNLCLSGIVVEPNLLPITAFPKKPITAVD